MKTFKLTVNEAGETFTYYTEAETALHASTEHAKRTVVPGYVISVEEIEADIHDLPCSGEHVKGEGDTDENR